MKKNGGESWPTPGAAIATIDNTVFRRTQKKNLLPQLFFGHPFTLFNWYSAVTWEHLEHLTKAFTKFMIKTKSRSHPK
jgi:hypothetical protein